MSRKVSIAALDRRYVWHPFTQMRDWLKREPIVISEAAGAVLRDVKGREYLDANSSIWTNLHGHNHPAINRALNSQLARIAHSSALGFANVPASKLAERLVRAANMSVSPIGKSRRAIAKAFFSDNGSTAMEVALKLAYEFTRRSGKSARPRFLSLDCAYHGDTIGAVSLGHIDMFHAAWKGLLFRSDKTPAPYCYRCPHNRARPDRTDAREYRKCNWECLDVLERKFASQKQKGNPYAAFVFEPLIQGAAGMIAQPDGWLQRACRIARGYGSLLIADEVMTGFGRTGAVQEGARSRSTGTAPALFACQKANVRPDLMALAKGLTGGYLPMAATLTTREIFDAFLGDYEEFKTFFHGHSYTGNQLGAAAGLASMDLLQSKHSLTARIQLEKTMRTELSVLWDIPQIGDIRQVGLVAGIELVRNWRTREPFDIRERAGIRVCDAMAGLGVLTRPIGNVIVIMPPYCTAPKQVRQIVESLKTAIAKTLG